MGKPQDLPAGQRQLQIGILLSFVTYVAALSGSYGIFRSALHAAVDLICSGVVFYVALHLLGWTARFCQGFGALCGAGAILNTAAIPIFLSRPTAGSPGTLSIFADFLLLVWSLSLFSHVVRHTFETGKLVSTLVAFAYIIVLITLMDLLFPPLNSASAVDQTSLNQSLAAFWLYLG